jgi:hypothetical protein
MLKKIPNEAAEKFGRRGLHSEYVEGGLEHLPNGLLKMASIKAARSEEPEAYESVRRRGLATENAERGHFQQSSEQVAQNGLEQGRKELGWRGVRFGTLSRTGD